MNDPQIPTRVEGFTSVDPLAETQPTYPQDTLSNYQPIPVRQLPPVAMQPRRKPGGWGCGCLAVLALSLFLVGLAIYLLLPPRTNILVLGIDDRAPGEALGRSDTMVLTTFWPAQKYLGMLSIPRDLWVQVPGYGQNRINTAHFFAEAAQPGSGGQAAKEVVQLNFGVDVHYYVRFRFDNFRQVIDAMGGIEVTLPEAMSGYPAGTHHLDSEQALAFVRDRAGSDDFSRMQRGQILLRSLALSALSPVHILHWPKMIQVGLSSIETDIPLYLWPKFGLILGLVGTDGIDSRIISREMVRPFATSEGAQVLEPMWDQINPVLLEMFGQ